LSTGRTSNPTAKAELNFSDLTVCLKAYPDTNLEFSAACLKDFA
jgi:hypothetical protein